MPNTEILAKITDILSDVLDNPDLVLAPETTAADVPGWDSMAQIKLLMAIEEDYSIQFSTIEMDRFRNVGDLVAAVAKRTGG